MKKIYLFLVSLFFCQFMMAQNNSILRGILVNAENQPISKATIYLDGNKISQTTQDNGEFEIPDIAEGEHKITFASPSFKRYTKTISVKSNEPNDLTIVMQSRNINEGKEIEDIYIYGAGQQLKGMDMITRLPIKPREMPQNISVISDKIIEEQGAQTLTDAVRNVPGVTLFGTYGGVKESMSIRGYRGTPVLKNGVQVDSDFRTASILTDMQGVESIQVIRGSAAITQGIGNGLGSPGGVINIVTKTPQFLNGGKVALETGSWGLFRPTLDYQTVLDKNQTVAFRINSAYQRKDSYKPRVNNNRIYVNPSLEWRLDKKTRITLEMDYLNDNTTPDRGTVNLSDIDKNNLLNTTHKFLGWGTDNVNTKTTTYSAKMVRDLTDKLSLRAIYAGSVNDVENIGVSLKQNSEQRKNIVSRSLSRSDNVDKNKVFQIDLIGKNIYTGKIKHTIQTGFDYKIGDKTNISYSTAGIDNINVLEDIPNNLPSTINNSQLKETTRSYTKSEVYGLMAQDAIQFNKYVRANVALRYSQDAKKTNAGAKNYAWDPFFGVMITPIEDISVFGNYATTTNLRSASNPTQDGSTLGASVTNQWEVGVKSDWFNKKLSFNVTYYSIKNSDISYQVYENGVPLPYYAKAGDLKRSGIEFDINGRILENLKVILGYSYSDVQYRNSIAYVNGSRPMNAPYNTFNGWAQYMVNQGTLKNLSFGVGVYYVGDRPVNDYSADLKKDPNGTIPGKKPFNMPDYTTVNAQLGYSYQNIGIQVFFNNIFDKLGYTSYYRGGYINQIDPRNFKVQLSYKF